MGEQHSDHDAPRRWEYRVLSRTIDSGVPGMEPVEVWSLIEAYYADDGRIVAWGEAGALSSDISLEDLEGEAWRRHRAVQRAQGLFIERRVLTEDDLPAPHTDYGSGA